MRGSLFRRIVVPTDGRPGSAEATRFAAGLARIHRAEIVACYVIDRGLVARTLASVRDAMRAELEAEGRRALQQATAICRRAGVPAREALVEGDPVREIVTAIRRARANLVVMRTTGRGPVASLLVGSIGQAIIGRAPCPVLLVRPGTERRPRRPTARRTRRA